MPPLVRDFYRQVSYRLDLGEANPVKRLTKYNYFSRLLLTVMREGTTISELAGVCRAKLGKVYQGGCVSDGGVAQLVRAAES